MSPPIDSDGTWTTLPGGTVLVGRYEVQTVVGTGGMGSVYAAFDHELGERVALEVLSRARDDEPRARAPALMRRPLAPSPAGPPRW